MQRSTLKLVVVTLVALWALWAIGHLSQITQDLNDYSAPPHRRDATSINNQHQSARGHSQPKEQLHRTSQSTKPSGNTFDTAVGLREHTLPQNRTAVDVQHCKSIKGSDQRDHAIDPVPSEFIERVRGVRHLSPSQWRDAIFSSNSMIPSSQLGDMMCRSSFASNPMAPKPLEEANASSLHWLRTSGIWKEVVGCSFGIPPLSHVVPETLRWKPSVDALPLLPTTTIHEAARNVLPLSTFTRVPKSASWMTATNVCASCEATGTFYMNPRHKCFTTMWGIGDAKQLRKLVSTARNGRNVIFKERVGSYQYGGVLTREQFVQQVDANGQRFTSTHYVKGTSVWHGEFEVDNVGHVIHDAVWAWQLTLMLPHILKKPPNTLYPSPVRGVFSQGFTNISSDYFGALSWLAAHGELSASRGGGDGGGVDELVRSPFDDTTVQKDRPLVCFEKLIVPGQDRHADGGGLGLRSIVAQRLRRHVYQSIGEELSSSRRAKRPVMYVYGRNDVHRRSVDNLHDLWNTVLLIARSYNLPTPIMIPTFTLSPQEQWKLMANVDILVAIQGSHLQNSLFMPHDGAIVEIAPCRADRVSFMHRYGKYLDSHHYRYVPVCDNSPINYSDQDPAAQNITLCPNTIQQLKRTIGDVVKHVMGTRGLR